MTLKYFFCLIIGLNIIGGIAIVTDDSGGSHGFDFGPELIKLYIFIVGGLSLGALLLYFKSPGWAIIMAGVPLLISVPLTIEVSMKILQEGKDRYAGRTSKPITINVYNKSDAQFPISFEFKDRLDVHFEGLYVKPYQSTSHKISGLYAALIRGNGNSGVTIRVGDIKIMNESPSAFASGSYSIFVSEHETPVLRHNLDYKTENKIDRSVGFMPLAVGNSWRGGAGLSFNIKDTVIFEGKKFYQFERNWASQGIHYYHLQNDNKLLLKKSKNSPEELFADFSKNLGDSFASLGNHSEEDEKITIIEKSENIMSFKHEFPYTNNQPYIVTFEKGLGIKGNFYMINIGPMLFYFSKYY